MDPTIIAGALQLASAVGPAVVTLIQQITHKDGSVSTSATVIVKLNDSDAQFADNLKATSDWMAAHGLTADGKPATKTA